MTTLLFVIILLLTACRTPPTGTPPPTLQPVEVALTPSLIPARDALHTCAMDQPEIALILSEISAPFLDIPTSDLSLWFGPPPDAAGYAAPLVQEEIVVVVNPNNIVSAISTDSLRAIFTGTISRWEEVGGNDHEIQVWMLPERDEFTQVFRRSVLPNQSFSSLALLVPDPAAMLEAASEEPTSIGFLPKAWLTNEVKTLRLERRAREGLRQPVLALSATEPQGAVRNYLHCLQSGEGQEVLKQRYQAWEEGSALLKSDG